MHNDPFTLTLTGPAGGQFTAGENGEHVELDALDFCRTLAGRLTSDGVLRHRLPL